MMRTIYLIRHAMPAIPIGERWCVGGRTDLPLGTLGRLQAALLPYVPALQTLNAVFCSTLIRARETALPLSPEPRAVPGLEEQDMGAWDGLSFVEIQRRFPALYLAREKDPSLLPEGAEADDAVRARMRGALLACLRESEGDIAVVSHKSAIASITGQRSSLGYTSLSVLRCDGDTLRVEAAGLKPDAVLSDAACVSLLKAAGADEARIAHCRAVAELADELCAALNGRGLALDAQAVHRAALLHDLARGEPDHAALGALWLRELGYPELSGIVRQHHDLDAAELSEAAVVFLADKAVRGDRRVPIDERFEASLKKCRTPEALAAHARRRRTAKEIQNRINRLCETEII